MNRLPQTNALPLLARSAAALALVLLLSACDQPQPAATPAAVDEPGQHMQGTAMTEPRADKRPVAHQLHGVTRVDEYFWLRDDERSAPDVLAYLEQENAWFEQEMAHTAALQETLFEEMTGRLDPDESSVPYLKNGYWHYYRYEPGQDYAIYARRAGSMDAPEEILLDANQRAAGHGFYQLLGLEISDDGRFVAIAEDTMGRRINEIRILDTEAGSFLPEVIGNASSSLAFSADGKYLFYLDKHPETLLAYRVMRHELGTDPGEDVLMYEEQDDTFYSGLARSRSGDYIFLMHRQTDTTEVQLLAADNPLGEFSPFLPREEGHEYSIDQVGERFYIHSNWQAENFRVMTTSLAGARNKSSWQELVPARSDAMVESVQPFDDWLLLGERKDGLRQLRVMALDGSVDRYLEAPEQAYVMWPEDNPSVHTETVRYAYSSLVTPEQVWEIDLASGESRLLKAERVPGYDSSGYTTKRSWVEARDGVQVPVTLVHRNSVALDGSAPALVYAYGSYGSSSDPYFRSSIVSLLDRGFVYVIAHIRGGQEMGRQWYEQGRLMNKNNSFNDFVDVTQALQQRRWVDPARTYALGGSAGGLLMGAVINQAPQLYHGVIAAVPFVDVVTTMLDESIPLTTGEFNEWGNPKEKAAFDYMLSYSPYDQVKAQDYPNLLVTTGLHDSQVQYFEPAKWVARLRDRRTDDNRLLMHTNLEAGHGGASGRYRRYEELARDYAFLVDLAGMEK
jgi:oligopeptidase B